VTKTRRTPICTAKIHQRLHSLKLQAAAFPPTHDIVTSLFALKNVPLWQAFAINVVLFSTFSSKLLKSLTSEGFAHAMVLGTLLWATLGFRGWLVCVSYLIFGSAVTKIRFKEKEAAGIAEARGGRRGPENVWGSALVALICAACSVQGGSFLGIESSYYVLAFVSSLATKLADTFASEIGKAYGKTAFLITTFERVPPGTEGAISVEGTVAAIVGGTLLSIIGCGLLKEISFPGGVAISTTASFLATNAESVIGASTQGKKGFTWMTNEVVNFLNTLIGAGIAIAGGKILL